MDWLIIAAPIRRVICGQAALIVCMALYLVWWCIVFHPGGGSTPVSNVSIALAVVAGIAGVALSAIGLTDLPAASRTFPNWYIAIGGVIIYVVLLILTWKLLSRPVTTELFLIIGFGVLELYIVNSFLGIGAFGSALAWTLAAVLIAVLAVSMFCYIRYYQLGALSGFVDGMIPLIIAGAYMVAIIVAILVCV